MTKKWIDRSILPLFCMTLNWYLNSYAFVITDRAKSGSIGQQEVALPWKECASAGLRETAPIKDCGNVP